MPLAVENLTKDSSSQAVQDAISASYETCLKEPGMTPEKCGGQIDSILKEKGIPWPGGKRR